MSVNRIKSWPIAGIVFALAILAVLAISCSDDGAPSPYTLLTVSDGWGPDVEINGEMVSISGCISYFAPMTETSVEWTYDGNGTLDLIHRAAAFNCCPQPICSVAVDDKTITVFERDAGVCLCLCLVDAGYQITGLPPGKYLLRFDEYTPLGDDEPLECEIVLKGIGSSGSCSAERTHYPWDAQPVPTGELISCELGTSNCPYPFTGCASWEYDGTNLSLFHQNDYGSCCILGEPSVDFYFSGNNIMIDENVQMGFLAMMTTVNIDMLISDLPPGEYNIDLNRFMGMAPIQFTVDLINEPTGEVAFDTAMP